MTTRRRFLTTVSAAFAGMMLLGACGPADDGGPAGTEGATRTVVDSQGAEVDVPEAPERIVALSEPTVDGLLALGIEPVGITAGRGQQGPAPYLGDAAAGIEIVGKVGEPNVEAVGAARPDLIVLDGSSVKKDPAVIDQLSQIAPVFHAGDSGTGWQENFGLLADAVNRTADAENVVSEYEDRIAEVKEGLGDEYDDKTFSVVRWQGNGPSLILKELAPGRVLSDLGLQRPPAQDREGPGHSEPVSNENLRDIDADYMFFGSLGGSSVGNKQAGGGADEAASARALESARDVPGFSDLSAVKADRVIPVDGAAWTSAGGPLQTMRILDDIEAALQK